MATTSSQEVPQQVPQEVESTLNEIELQDTPPQPNIEEKDNVRNVWQVPVHQFPVIDVPKEASKSVRKFYQAQNETVEELKTIKDKIQQLREKRRRRESVHLQPEGVDAQAEEGVQGEAEDTALRLTFEKEERLTAEQAAYEQFCIQASFWINVLLAMVKLGSSIVSLSLSVITSTFDSFLDLLVGAIIWFANRLRNKTTASTRMRYPVGRARLEPLGFIIFASIMSTASLFIVVEGIQQIAEGIVYQVRGEPIPVSVLSVTDDPSTLKAFYWVGVAVLAFTIIIKFILWLICRRATYSSASQAYATDHMNDVLTNFVALVAVFTTQWVWWFDPAGAIVLSIYIVFRWSKESIPHILNLVGRTADREFINRVTFIAMNHNVAIEKVDTVQAWYMGDGLYVELDIVMDTMTPLIHAHDIAEELQLTIEQMPEVERCYVHIDYEYQHRHKDEHLSGF
jgi:cation diffusion facilitator family transporter